MITSSSTAAFFVSFELVELSFQLLFSISLCNNNTVIKRNNITRGFHNNFLERVVRLGNQMINLWLLQVYSANFLVESRQNVTIAIQQCSFKSLGGKL